MHSLGGLKDYLNAAVQLKTALVKSRPGRQEWENAPPFFRCTAAPPEAVLRARGESFAVRYSTASQLKEQGNDSISKDPEAALQLYTSALAVFLWFDRGPDKASEDMPLVSAVKGLDGAERDQAEHLLTACFCNAAACLLQLGLHADAVYACSKALSYDPYCVKALYRRAAAQRRLGSRAGLEACLSDLEAALALEPASSEVRHALLGVQAELREIKRKELAMYGNMFERGRLYDEPGPREAPAAADASSPVALASGHQRRTAGTEPQLRMRRGGATGGSGGREPGGHGGEGGGEGGYGSHGDGDTEGEDPEDLLSLDPRKRKAEAAAAAREADLALRRMALNLARAKDRRMANRMLQAEGAAARGTGAGAGGGRAGGALAFPWWAVPWWAYLLIGLHLVYRLIKLWQVQALPAKEAGADGAAPLIRGHDRGEL